jgi:hypothetical protein
MLNAISQPEIVRQTLLPMLQPKPHNRCPDCLYIKLTGKPKPNASNQIDLYLTINFNEQWEDILGGRIKLGLKGGELRLKLANSTMPYELRELTGTLALSVPKKRVEQAGKKAKLGIEAAVSEFAIVPAIAGKAETKANVSSEQTQEFKDEFQFTACQITTKGSEENPAWAFTTELGQPVLKGLLKQALLGTLKLRAKPCWVEATFEVSKCDVYFTDAEGLWPPDISRNKRAVLERMIALHLLESKLKPYLSKAELHYD